MWGAIIGDIVGSVYEFNRTKTKDFQPLFHAECHFTDDTVCTVALAHCLIDDGDPAEYLREWCFRYPDLSYGASFKDWLNNPSMGPYNSFGNGAAMRVSSAALLGSSLDEALGYAERFTYPTHNHSEGIRGALAVTETIWRAFLGFQPFEIRQRIASSYDYDLSATVDEIRPNYVFNETCQGTVPQAITCALEAINFEDAIRNAISLGGDSDTIASIAGAIAEARFGCPADILKYVRALIPDEMADVMDIMYGLRRMMEGNYY